MDYSIILNNPFIGCICVNKISLCFDLYKHKLLVCVFLNILTYKYNFNYSQPKI